MIRSSKILIASIALLLLAGTKLNAQEVKDGLTWYTDVNQVYEVSQKTHKPVFAFFTGSDWCGWCHRLEDNVFHKPGFKAWAAKNVILLELDFPRNKKLPDALAEQNNGLQQFFQVRGYPTIWLFTMEKDVKTKKFNISAMGSLGYPECVKGREEPTFIENANKILENKGK